MSWINLKKFNLKKILNTIIKLIKLMRPMRIKFKKYKMIWYYLRKVTMIF